VKISTGWCLVPTWANVSNPTSSFFRTQWQSISICYVRSWNIGLRAICGAASLSQQSRIGGEKMPKDARKDLNQTNSLVVSAMEWYSTSAEDRDTVGCFLLRQEIGDPPSMIK